MDKCILRQFRPPVSVARRSFVFWRKRKEGKNGYKMMEEVDSE